MQTWYQPDAKVPPSTFVFLDCKISEGRDLWFWTSFRSPYHIRRVLDGGKAIKEINDKMISWRGSSYKSNERVQCGEQTCCVERGGKCRPKLRPVKKGPENS